MGVFSTHIVFGIIVAGYIYINTHGMKKLILLLLLLPVFAKGQINYPNGTVFDSTTFTFSNDDSLTHYLNIGTIGPLSNPTTAIITIDTSSTTLWQIGNTLKSVFSNDTIAAHGIMTDTAHPYPLNANDFFILKVDYLVPNFIVDFWHKYQFDSLHSGGIVEFSFDSGMTWMNVAYCNMIDTQNIYSSTDTIFSGQPAFKGNSNGEQLSRLQFMNCEIAGIRQTATSCLMPEDLTFLSIPIYLRFRFVSDSTIDSLSGWMIDSIRIENVGCKFLGGYVAEVNKQNIINLYPNPATTEITIMATDEISSVVITNLLGQTVFAHEYKTEEVEIDVSALPPGVYFVKINGTDVRKFLKE